MSAGTGTGTGTGDEVAQIDGLRVSYLARGRDVVVVDGLSLSLARGETVGLVGESGSGKSTVARTLLGSLRPGSRIQGGTVRVQDRDVLTLPERELRALRGAVVALVAQNAGQALTPSMRVGAQLAETLAVHDRETSRERLVELARLVRLPDPESMLERYPHQLSGGQQQRVAIAMAVATDPAVLVLDEPTTALDVVTQAAVLALVEELQERLGMAVLVVSHDLGVVSAVADHVIVMHRGRAVEAGPTQALLASPKQDYTRELLAAAPRVHSTGGTVEVREPRDVLPWVLRCEALAVRYPGADRRAVSGLDLLVRRGETVAVVGESGSGKSTVATALAGLAPVESGSATLAGPDGPVDLLRPAHRRPADVRRQVQMIFQNADLALNPRRSVGDAVARPLRLFGRARGRAQVREQVARLLEEVGLDPAVARRVPAQLSGGQRQRVGIARALAAEPTLLVADEITTALDVSVQAEVLELLDDLRASRDLSCLFISHDLAVVRSIAHRVVVMKDGWVVESAPTRDVFADPRHPYTRTLLEAVLEPGATALPRPDLDTAGAAAYLGGDLVDVGGGHLVRAATATVPA